MYTSTTFANRTTVARSLKKIHVARIIVLVLFLSPVWVSAQVLTPVELPENGVTEAPLYEDEHGNRYSTLVVVRFDELVFDSTRGQEVVSLANDLVNGKQTLGTALGNLDLTYGSYQPVDLFRGAGGLIGDNFGPGDGCR